MNVQLNKQQWILVSTCIKYVTSEEGVLDETGKEMVLQAKNAIDHVSRQTEVEPKRLCELCGRDDAEELADRVIGMAGNGSMLVCADEKGCDERIL